MVLQMAEKKVQVMAASTAVMTVDMKGLLWVELLAAD